MLVGLQEAFRQEFFDAGEQAGLDRGDVEAALATQAVTITVVRNGEIVAAGSRSIRGQSPDAINGVGKGGIRAEIWTPDRLASGQGEAYTRENSGVLCLGMAAKMAAGGLLTKGWEGAKADKVVNQEVAADEAYLTDVIFELEMEMLTAEMMGPFRDVPAPDANTNPTIMQALARKYGEATGDPFASASHTGKLYVPGSPDGGVIGRDDATSRGVRLSLQEYANHTNQNFSGKSFVAIGFGNVGALSAWELQEQMGMHMRAAIDAKKIVVAKDPKRPLRIGKEQGPDVDIVYDSEKRCIGWVNQDVATVTLRPEDQSHPDFQKGADDVLAIEGVDVGILGGLGQEIHANNVDRVAPKILLGGSNNSVASGVIERLAERRRVNLDFRVANGNGAGVSTKEHEQNVKGTEFTLAEIEKFSDILMADAWARVFASAEAHHRDPEVAMFHLAAAVTRVAIAEMVAADKRGKRELSYMPNRSQPAPLPHGAVLLG